MQAGPAPRSEAKRMTERTKPSGASLLQRWSRLKHEAREKNSTDAAVKSADAAATPIGVVPVPSADAATASAASPVAAGTTAQGAPPLSDDSLPPVESLTIESDFSAFMQPKVQETLRRRALKQLFRDPHFNVMDGLDVYIDDYSKPDPIPPEIVREMVQARYIFNPPATRINAQGHAEDVPEVEIAVTERNANDAAPQAETAGAAAVASTRLPPAEADAAAVLPRPSDGAASTAMEADGDCGAQSAPSANDRAAR
jgi:hypothetical protein